MEQVCQQRVDVNIGEAGQGAVRLEGGTGGDENGAHLRGGIVIAMIAAVLAVGMLGDVVVRGDLPADIGDRDHRA